MSPHRDRDHSEADDDDGDGDEETAREEQTDVDVVVEVVRGEIEGAAEMVQLQDIRSEPEEGQQGPEDGIEPHDHGDDHGAAARGCMNRLQRITYDITPDGEEEKAYPAE